MSTKLRLIPLALSAVVLAALPAGFASAQPANCPAMRKINIGVSVAPPNVVHTSPYVAKALGYFEKRCIDANIVQFEGGQSQTSAVAAAQGTAIVSVSDVSIGRGLKVQQIWALAPRMPQAYMVPGDIKSAADLKGKRLSATGGGVGGFNWRMGREVLKSAKLDVGDAQFIPSPTAGRLPGLIAGQIDGVALHPEDVFLARKQKDSRRSDAALHVQRLWRLDRMDRARPAAVARHRRRHDRGQSHDLPRQGQGRADHGGGDPEAEGGGGVRLGDRDQELHLVGQHRLYRKAHAMVDRQQRGERRHRSGEEAEC